MSQQYLRIASPVETSPEAFTVLGASSARGDADKIGQFGSGAKHAVLCALRAGLQMLIYCGKIKIVPMTQPQQIHGTIQERVCFRIGNKLEQSSMTLDFGALDWTQPVAMLMREIVSNALDAVDGAWNKIVFEYVEKPRAKSGWTQVFIPLTHEIREYMGELHRMFLHVDNQQSQSLIAKKEPNPCRFYRKGVFVHEVGGTKSLFDYNCGDELPIDESRNLDSDRVRNFACRLLTSDTERTKHVLQLVHTGDSEYYESKFSYYHMIDSNVAEAARQLWGDDVCVTSSLDTFARAKAKGLNVILMPSCGWYDSLSQSLPLATSKLSKADAEGLTVFPPSATLVYNVQTIWQCLAECGFTGSVDMPACAEYEKPLNGGSQVWGFYEENEHKVYLHREHADNWSTILEELSHATTGANDCTRDFQSFAFSVAAELMKRVTI